MSERVIVAGGTGFVGRALTRHLAGAGYEPIVLTRGASRQGVKDEPGLVRWDGLSCEGWSQQLEDSVAVVNLAGEGLGGCRWSRAKKQAIRQSRLQATEAIVEGLRRTRNRPDVLVQVSAVGYYGSRGDEILSEESQAGEGFLSELCQEWERAAGVVVDLGIRLAIARLGVVLGGEGGFIRQVRPAFMKLAGGTPGDGRQWMSWVHRDDVVGVLRWLMETEACQGSYNVVAPSPVPAGSLFKSLGAALHRPCWMPMPALGLRAAFGEMADEVLLASQRVVPARLLEADYPFRYEHLQQALDDIFLHRPLSRRTSHDTC